MKKVSLLFSKSEPWRKRFSLLIFQKKFFFIATYCFKENKYHFGFYNNKWKMFGLNLSKLGSLHFTIKPLLEK